MASSYNDIDAEQADREHQLQYLSFLDDELGTKIYQEKLADMAQESAIRLIVNINDVRKELPERATCLLSHGFEEIVVFQRALKELLLIKYPDFGKVHDEFHLGFEGSFGQRHVTPRTLKSRFIGNMVCCEGIVTKCSLVRPKVVRSVHFCPATKKTLERRYTDLTSFDPFPSSTIYPQHDDQKNPLETEYGLSSYKDHQTLTIQEMPESAPAGQLPRSVDVVADLDLVDSCKPGDRVRIVGVYRCLPNKHAGYTSGTFRTILIANNVQLVSKESAPNFNQGDVENIRKFGKNTKEDPFEVLSRSLAPSIHGHEYVKQAILCLLLGGVEKVLANGTRLRGDINILLIGDPSVAKSQLLRYVLNTAPRAIPTTGRGSSGVGLTAAVTTDPDTGERRLEAGAMVLGDRGVVCIDEFDKMTEIDRTAIHEVMEQGRVTIAKAGIHAKLNARCSVLAAANPVYGRYDQSKSPMDNIGLQDSLLSRFDLIFILLDKHQKDQDERISEHVLKMHRYRSPGEEDGAVLVMGDALQALTTEDIDSHEETGEGTPIWEENDSWIPRSAGSDERFVSIMFMKKFIHLAKNIKPVLSKDAAAFIAEQYAELRQNETKKSEKERTTPVTARTLETMIRLATAHAKCRLSKDVSIEDARKAYELLYFACFKEAPKRVKKRVRRPSADGEENVPPPRSRRDKDPNEPQDVYDFDSDGEDEEYAGGRPASYKTATKRRRDDTQQPSDSADIMDTGTTDDSLPTSAGTGSQAATISTARYEQFKKLVRPLFTESRADTLPVDEVVKGVQQRVKQRFTAEEVEAAIEHMCSENAVMVTDGSMIII